MGKRMHAMGDAGGDNKTRFVMLIALPNGHAGLMWCAGALAAKIVELPGSCVCSFHKSRINEVETLSLL